MTNISLIFILLIFFLIVSFLFFSYLKGNKRSLKKTKIFPSYKDFIREKELNPDISTDNWDLHKIRLKKFRRSQYKGLTFFMSSENRIYYLTEEGDKVYC